MLDCEELDSTGVHGVRVWTNRLSTRGKAADVDTGSQSDVTPSPSS